MRCREIKDVSIGSSLYPITRKGFLYAGSSPKNFQLDDHFNQSFFVYDNERQTMKTKKGKIDMKLQTLIHILIGIVCIGLLPKTQAVSPPPDGGYPGGNTAEGTSALLSRTTGTYNTAVGIYSLLSLTEGNVCTGVGAGTLLANTADENTATGAGALLTNPIGDNNTAHGAFALF